MKKITVLKGILLALVVVAMAFSLVACSSNAKGDYEPGVPEAGVPDKDYGYDGSGDITDVPSGGVTDTVNRKQIFYVSMAFECEDITACYDTIVSEMGKDSWIDSETQNTNSIKLAIRIKSDNLDAFIDAISGDEVVSFSKTVEDVSDEYFDIEGRINTLTIEKQKLEELLATNAGSLNEIMMLTERLATIQGTLDKLNGQLSGYDSLVEYSTVTISIYSNGKAPVEVKYGEKLGQAFVGAWSALGEFFQWLLLALVAVFPFALVLAPVGFGVYVLVRKANKRIIGKKVEKQEEEK